jgi:hypothetical protein
MRNLWCILFLVLTTLSSCQSDSYEVKPSRSKQEVFFSDSLDFSDGEKRIIFVTDPTFCGSCTQSIAETIQQISINKNFFALLPLDKDLPFPLEKEKIIRVNEESLRRNQLFLTTSKLYVIQSGRIVYETTIHEDNIDEIRNRNF